MNDRDYLRSLGFVVGERGRYSKPMLEALAKRKSDSDNDAIDEARSIVGVPAQTRVREPEQLFGYTLEGYKVGFIMCRSCDRHMSFCVCEGGIHAPKVIVATKDPRVVVGV